MKNKITVKMLLMLVLILSTSISAQYAVSKVDEGIFPKSEKGMKQFVISVPHSTMGEDANKKIEIFVGKYVEVDQCNTHFLSGELVEKDLKGYGYTYYEFKTNGNVAGTLMGCNNTEKVSKFVSAKSLMKDYNGRMPIIIYAPEGYDVQFKIYKADPEVYRAAETNK